MWYTDTWNFSFGSGHLKLTVNSSAWKRFFSVPCALVDNYLKLADGPALKVILYLIASEDIPDEQKIISATGITKDAFEDAVSFWTELGVLSAEGDEKAVVAPLPSTAPHAAEPETVKRVIHSRYAPKDIAEMLRSNSDLKELFTEAESTLGRILKHADHEILISLKDYYGFSEQSIVLILSYCRELDKTSARYYETVAKSLFEKGATDFHSIETEFERLKEQYSYEAKIRQDFGMDTKLTSRQLEYITSWKNMGFEMNMIALAREKCVDATNKLSFPYIDKILKSWQEKEIYTPEAADNEQKPKKQTTESSFDLDEFDMFTLGTGRDAK